jgi:hypothetical protein
LLPVQWAFLGVVALGAVAVLTTLRPRLRRGGAVAAR